jgi:hypothetical protein
MKDVHKLKNFAIGISPDVYSYVVFMQTRTPTNSFYKWYSIEYLILFVLKLRECYETDSWFLMQLDGEVDQISVFKDVSVVEFMHKNRIVIA